MRFIRKALLVFAFMEYAAFRVCRRFGNGLFFNRLRTAVLIIIMIVKRLLSALFSLSILLSSLLLYIPHKCEKAQLSPDFFDSLSSAIKFAELIFIF